MLLRRREAPKGKQSVERVRGLTLTEESPNRHLKLPSISPKYRHPTSDKEATLEQLELAALFKRLDIAPSSTRHRSPLVRKEQNDIFSSDLHVPCTTSIPEEPEVAAFITALVTGQQSPYRKHTIGGLEQLDMHADQLLGELNHAAKGRESPLPGLLPTAAPQSLKSQARKFWQLHISSFPAVRWDLFEESLLLYLDRTMIVSVGSIRKVDWAKFFKTLCSVLSYEDAGKREWPRLPGVTWERDGKERKVLEGDWANFLASGGLNHSVLMALDERSHFFSELYQFAVPSKQYTYGSLDSYQGQWKLSKRHGQGSLHFAGSNETYTGQFVQGLRDGYGTMQGREVVYKGKWKQDLRDGFGLLQLPGATFRGIFQGNEVKSGVCRWTDGSQYEGEWQDSQFCGQGQYFNAEGLSMVGQWKEGKLHGSGLKVLPSGERWQGEWIAGELEGEGEINLIETVYRGSVVAGLEHGFGTKTWKSTNMHYKGLWESGQMHGEGELQTSPGDLFSGMFQGNLLPSGHISFQDGRHYLGELKDLTMHGHGTLSFPSSEPYIKYIGSFEDNAQSGPGLMRYRDGSTYQGQWADSQPQGRGELQSAHFVYRGEFAGGKYEGQGEVVYADGGCYKGRFKAGLYDGLGELKDSSGTLLRALFEAGRPL